MPKKSELRIRCEQQAMDEIREIKQLSYPTWLKEYLILITDPTGKAFKAAWKSFSKGKAERDIVASNIAKKYNVTEEMIERYETLVFTARMHDYQLTSIQN